MKRNGTSKLNICFVRSLLVFLLLLALMLPMVSICCSAASIVNIYYDRKVHELQFYSSTGNNSLVRTIRELYQGLTMCWAISAADRKYISRYLRRMWIRLLFSPPVRVLKRTDES